MRTFDVYDTFLLVSGKNERVEFVKNMLKENDSYSWVKVENQNRIKGKYSIISLELYNNNIVEEIKKEAADVECYYFQPEKYGSYEIQYSALGNSNVYTGFAGPDLEDWGDIIHFRTYRDNYIKVFFGSDECRTYGTNYDFKNMVSLMANNKIGVLDIARLTTKYVAKNSIIEHCSSFVNLFTKKDKHISKIIITSEERIPKIDQKYLASLNDPSVINFIQSHLYRVKTAVFNMEENAFTLETNEYLYVMDPELKNYVEIAVHHEITDKSAIPGLNNEPTQFMLEEKDGKSTCLYCYSDEKEIVLPDADLNGHPLNKIRPGCFNACNNAESIYIPNTIKSFDENVFVGPKKLKAISYKDSTDDEIVLITGTGKLNYVCTPKTGFKIPENVKTISSKAFCASPKLRSVEITGNIEKIDDKAFSECTTLKTLRITQALKEINKKSLENSNITLIETETGEQITMPDRNLVACILQNPVRMDYKAAAKACKKIKSVSVRADYAYYLLKNHEDKIEESISDLMDIAIRYCVGKPDEKMLNELLEMKLEVSLDLEALVDLAKQRGNLGITAILLDQLSKENMVKKNVIKTEKPAPSAERSFIRVRFADNKSYTYFCDYQINVGDTVYVEGKRAGEPGQVSELIDNWPSGRAAMYTLKVTEAFNVTTEEVDDPFSL